MKIRHNDKKSDTDSEVFVYSANQMTGEALRYIFSTDSNIRMTFSASPELLLKSTETTTPGYFVFDIPPRECTSLIYTIRRRFPAVAIIFMQKGFLFSDRVICEYIGHAFLLEYEAALSAYPEYTPRELFSNDVFSGGHCGGGYFGQEMSSGMSETLFRQHLNDWLRHRLAGLVSSSRIRNVVMDGIIQGASALETGRAANISHKVVHFYRRHVMAMMGISHFSREFIPSLKI